MKRRIDKKKRGERATAPQETLSSSGKMEVWQFDDGKHGWKPYGAAEQQALAVARAAGLAQLTLGAGKWSYSVDLEAMTQINTHTGKTRRLRVTAAQKAVALAARDAKAASERLKQLQQLQAGGGGGGLGAMPHARAKQPKARPKARQVAPRYPIRSDLAICEVDCTSDRFASEFDKSYVTVDHPRVNQDRWATAWRGSLAGRSGSQSYFCPSGWRRFSLGVSIDETFFKDSSIMYHGTAGKNVGPIVRDGFNPRECQHGAKAVYLTPSIRYAQHPRYARVYKAGGHYFQIILEVPSPEILAHNKYPHFPRNYGSKSCTNLIIQCSPERYAS